VKLVRRILSQADKEPTTEWVTWEAPPPPRSGYDWMEIANQLRSRPGEWAKIFDDGRISIVNAIRQGNVGALNPVLGFEVRTRNNVRAPVRKCSLYMRWNPPSQKEE
jgi:hypothetical protein